MTLILISPGAEKRKNTIPLITACRFKCKKVEVIEVRNTSETKGPQVLHLSDGASRFNLNNGSVTLYKGSLFPAFVQTKVPIEIQTPEGG